LLYFAYGSNMLPARLTARCPSARVIGPGTAADFGLRFTKPSKDGSGKATLVEQPGVRVPGVLYEVAIAEREALDRFEGRGGGYDRDDSFLVLSPHSDAPVVTSTYLADGHDDRLKPFDWYLAIVIAGAAHHCFGEEYLGQLRRTAWQMDEKATRFTRIAAIEAMRGYGIEDHMTLLAEHS
jgi:hypothetical protein